MIQKLPHLNALLNALAAVLLALGWLLIRRKHYRAHAAAMIAATAVSALFLAGYLIHKAVVGEQSTRNLPGLPGWLRAIYLAILFPHLVLALAMLPMIFVTFRRAIRRDWPRHPAIGRPKRLACGQRAT